MPVTENTSARGTNSSSSASSLSATFGTSNGGTATVTASAGQLILIAAGVGDTIANTTKPSGYTDLFGPLQISGGQALFCMAKIAVGGETGVSWSHSGGANNMELAIFLFDGALSPLAIDKTATNPTDFSQHTSWATGTTAATTQADELAIGACVTNGANTSPAVSGGTLIAQVGSNELLVAKNPLVATGTQAMTFSWTNSNFVVAGIATIKAGPVSPTPLMGMF